MIVLCTCSPTNSLTNLQLAVILIGDGEVDFLEVIISSHESRRRRASHHIFASLLLSSSSVVEMQWANLLDVIISS
ncbi:hypothetical protein COP2_008249 [Malus domestica]